MKIEYVTHAALFLRSARVSLLTDPFFYPELDPTLAPTVRNFPPRDIEATGLGRLDFVYSSHEHHDHCHPQTLARLKNQIETVLLPAERPELEARYRRLGFRSIVFLENRKPVALGEGLEVTSYWDDPIDTCLLVKMEGKVVLHVNDSWPRPETLMDIAAACPVDYAFFCSTSAQDLYPLLLSLPASQLEELARAREEGFFAAQLQRIDALGPRVVIPYSYTAAYVQPDQIHLNGYSRLTPCLFRDRLKAHRPEVECWPLQPGDVIDTHSNTVTPLRTENLWGRDLPEFLENIREYSRSIQGSLPTFDFGEPESSREKLREHLQQRLEHGVPYSTFYAYLKGLVAIHVLGNTRTESSLVDLNRKAVSPWSRGRLDLPVPQLEISIPASLMESMLAGAYDPFMILYTYRVSFTAHESVKQVGFSPLQEFRLYVGAFLTLFMDLHDKHLATVRDWDEALATGAR